jgi:DNA-binding transcriptional MerR regulator/methylmalonyl-CoA mutase cobalamin-binding subunit
MGQLQTNGGAPTGYSIRVVSRLTGISSDTLRMWERRYGFPKPERNAASVRVYSQDDVERLMLVARTLKAGYRAGEVIHHSREELSELLANAAGTRLETGPTPASIQNVVAALERDDVDALRAELRQAVVNLGTRRFLSDVAAPLLEHVGEAWATGRLEVRHEHLLSEVLSTQLKLLSSAFDGATRGPVILLATLPGEQHSLGLEMVALHVALSGATPRVLGVDTPPDQIVDAARGLGAKIVGISLSAATDLDSAHTHLGWLAEELTPGTELWIGGRRAAALGDVARARRVAGWDDLDRELTRVLGLS